MFNSGSKGVFSPGEEKAKGVGQLFAVFKGGIVRRHIQQRMMEWARAASGEINFGLKKKHLCHESTEALEEKPRESEQSASSERIKTQWSKALNNWR